MRIAALVPVVLLTACAAEPTTRTSSEPVVYGEDNRQDVYAYADQEWAMRAAEVSVAPVSAGDINASNPNDVQLAAGTLGADYDLCADERFVNQPTVAGCSATLIAPDLVLTAGHCIGTGSCSGTRYVFDFWMTDANTLHTITTDDVYACAEVLVDQAQSADFAIVRLDRAVVGRAPARIALEDAALPDQTPLIVQGYPSTIPLKIDDGGAVRDGRPGTLDYFVANLDTFGGNSGSGVYTDAGLLVGILVRGESDYVQDGSCWRVHVCPENGCGGEESTYAYRAIAALCQSDPTEEPSLCECGNGTCNGTTETSLSCPSDCGPVCGDGACNGDETTLSCPGDCGACGNGACDNGETEDTCCDDCACTTEGELCYAHSCIPDPGVGDTCASAIEIPATGTQVIEDATSLANDDFEGTCVGANAPDRVYTFTLTDDTAVDAHVVGFDTGLYLRTACDDTTTEVECSDDVETGTDVSSRIVRDLAAGTYTLIVDGYDGESGTYELTVTFSCVDDADDDGTCDAADLCPDDPAKTEPGACGCGVEEGTCEEEEMPGDGGGCCSTAGGGPSGAALLGLLVILGISRKRARRIGQGRVQSPCDSSRTSS